MKVRPRNVYILGTAYCGSTLLGNSLNGHPSIAFAGEVSRLPAFGVGEAWTICPLCSAKYEACPVWSEEMPERMAQAGAGKALDVYREATGLPVVVDGSKHVSWIRKVHADVPLAADTIALAVVRSPLAFAASIKRRDGFPAWQSANIWRDTTFDMLRCLADLGLPHMIVRYEDFALEPHIVLPRICTLIAVDFHPTMLRFWEKPLHALGGNAGAYVWYKAFQQGGLFASAADQNKGESYQQRTFGGWADESWRKDMSTEEISLVIKTPMLADMCALVGYDLSKLVS